MKLRCAVVGLNRGSKFIELLQANPDCEVVAVCDARPEKLAEQSGIEGFTDYDEMLEKAAPDVVAIITPGPTHAPLSLAALQAGAHVLVETPNVYSAEEAEAVVSLARERGLKYMLAEDYIYMGWCGRLAEVVAEGALGEILGGMAEYTHDCRGAAFYDEEGRHHPLSAAGRPGLKPLWRFSDLPPLAYSSHTLGPLLHLMGDRCVNVTGVVAGRREVAGVDMFPLETAILETERGGTINLTNGFMLSHPFVFFLALYGTEGSIRVMNLDYTDPEALRVVISTDAEGGGWRDMPMAWHERDDGRNHLQVMVDEFIAAVVNDTPAPFDEARSMDFCLPGVMAHESARRGGEKLEIPLF
ncbi:MAG: Gfo/Idh/MocA family oxidoreductase [Armatimonadetes bacterium]|nr:Gfo/Idh/MocA family oxidoreductase [Armatimonadota bacterium]